MRKLILTFVTVALLAGLLAWAMMRDSGYLLVAVGQYSVEMSLATAAVILLLAYLLLRVIGALRRWLVSASKGIISSDWFYRVRRDRARTTLGFSHYLQGQWRLAERNLTRGAKFSDAPALNYLGAAIAAHELGDKQQAGRYLQQAEGVAQDSAAAIVKAKLYLEDRDYKSALVVLQQLHKSQPQDTSVLPLMVAARRGLADWDGLKGMLKDLKRHKVFSETGFQALQREVYLGLFRNHVGSVAGEAGQLWQEAPAPLRRDQEIVAVYARCLVASGKAEACGEAEKLLRKTINQQWSDKLVSLYGECAAEDAIQQLKTAEAWLPAHRDNAVLLATLGKLSARNRLWGKARDYLNKSLAVEPRADVYAQLGKLLAQLGEEQQSAKCYREGLVLAINS